MNFFNRFENFLTSEFNIQPQQKILIAVSGGIDSMVLLNLLMQTKFNFAVAHCNFCLRADESDGDNEFVKSFCNKNSIQFFDKKFETQKYSDENKIGIQEAARNLRYQWFDELLATFNFSFIATAHHLNDVTETLLFNIARGTGISGLHGIPSSNKKIIRPLLFATKNEIIDYANENNILFRNDSSNEKNKYSRNKIRNQVIPILKEINPLLEEHVHSLTNQISFVEKIYRKHIKENWEKIHKKNNDAIEICISDLLQLHHPSLYLFEFLNPFGFNSNQVSEIIDSLEEQSGKRFFSQTYFLIKDRESLIITKNNTQPETEIFIKEGTSLVELYDVVLKFEYLNSEGKIIYNTNVFYLDMDTFSFPIKIRNWNDADSFFPLGMKNKKKLSDFFIDEKINLIEKAKAKICCQKSGNIICVLPYRIDDRNKLTSQTKNILKIIFLKK